MKNYQQQIAKVIGMDRDGDLLLVRGMGKAEDYKRGGYKHGYRYEWGVNHYSFTENKENSMEAYGLSEAEYEHWNQLYIKKFSFERDEWYVDETVKTYVRLMK